MIKSRVNIEPETLHGHFTPSRSFKSISENKFLPSFLLVLRNCIYDYVRNLEMRLRSNLKKLSERQDRQLSLIYEHKLEILDEIECQICSLLAPTTHKGINLRNCVYSPMLIIWIKNNRDNSVPVETLFELMLYQRDTLKASGKHYQTSVAKCKTLNTQNFRAIFPIKALL